MTSLRDVIKQSFFVFPMKENQKTFIYEYNSYTSINYFSLYINSLGNLFDKFGMF